jgi:O-antigen/teichoic acid export membrane protein
LLNYGGNFSLLNFLNFIASKLDQIIVGKFISSESVGIYNRGKYLVSMPMYNVMASLTTVLFSSFSREQDNLEKLQQIYFNSMLISGLVIFPICFGMIPASKQIVLILLGSKWLDCVDILRICCIFVSVEIITSIAGMVCSATNRVKIQIKLQTIILLLLILTTAPVSTLGNLKYVCYVVGSIYWLRFFVYVFIVKSILEMSWYVIYQIHFPHIVVSGMTCVSVFMVTYFFNSLPPIVLLSIQVFTGCLAMVLYLKFIASVSTKKTIGNIIMRSDLLKNNPMLKMIVNNLL